MHDASQDTVARVLSKSSNTQVPSAPPDPAPMVAEGRPEQLCHPYYADALAITVSHSDLLAWPKQA